MGKMKVRNPARERLEKGEMSLGVGIRMARTVDIAKMMNTAATTGCSSTPNTVRCRSSSS